MDNHDHQKDNTRLRLPKEDQVLTGNNTPANKPVSAGKQRRPARWHVDAIVDSHALRARLTTIARTHADNQKLARKQILDSLHAALFRGRLIAQERLQQGADGLDTAHLLCAVQDAVLHALHDYTITHVFRAPNPTQGERLAIFATGGYGRGVLAPSSDIDLLFIRPCKASAHTESVLEYMLYALWDIGLKVGHAFRTPGDCVQLARKDVTVKTSLLDARFLFGDRKLAQETRALLHKQVVHGENARFIADKLAERKTRHARMSPSRYVVEPNIKDGKGGLRDLQTLYWIVRHMHPGDNATPEELMARHAFTRAEYHLFMRSARFLWTVRCHLHYLTGRGEERLGFDVQPEIAARMGYHDRNTQCGVERFMKRYFLAARDIGSLTRILTAKLEAEHMAPPAPWRRLLSHKRRKNLSDPLFALASQDRIIIHDETAFLTTPDAMLRLFRVADQVQVAIHPNALALVARNARRMNARTRTHPDTIKIFFDILLDSHDLRQTLNRMNEAGVLGRFLPEFGNIVAQTQFNMYHHYTVDEHTIRAVGHLVNMERGEAGHELPGTLFGKTGNRRALYLAMLLHDTGKSRGGDQQVEGMKTARQACVRLGLDRKETECVVWLVGNHLEMSEMAQKRDIADPRTIADFAVRVGNTERLHLLYLLTVADIRAVGPNVWNTWKGQLLSGLYHNTEAMLRSTQTDTQTISATLQERADHCRQHVEKTAGPVPSIMLEMDHTYWTGFDTRHLVEHARLLRRGDMVIVAARQRDIAGGVELFISAPDQVGLFSRLAGAIAGQGGNIVSAHLFTGKSGQVIDIFILQGPACDVFSGAQTNHLQALEKAVSSAIHGDTPPPAPAPPYRNDRKAAFIVKPQVTLSPDASLPCTVIDIAGRDRPGLLGDIGAVLADMDISIVSAHVSSRGERVFDAFYVRLPCGFDEAMQASLRTRLLTVIKRGEPTGPCIPAVGFRRARTADSF